jgi:hypothetical protein
LKSEKDYDGWRDYDGEKMKEIAMAAEQIGWAKGRPPQNQV